MKKILYILTLFLIISCNKTNNPNQTFSFKDFFVNSDLPKCNDSVVLNFIKDKVKVTETTDIKELQNIIFEEIFKTPFNSSSFSDNSLGYSYSDYPNLSRNEVDEAMNVYVKIPKYLNFYNESRFDSIPNSYKNIIAKYSKNMNPIYIPKIEDIRIEKENNEIKSCECEANLKFENSNYDKTIFYTIQKTTDGNDYVEIYDKN